MSDFLNHGGRSVKAENARLRTERDALVEALRFYADEEMHEDADVFMCGHTARSRMDMDKGRRARRALSRLEDD